MVITIGCITSRTCMCRLPARGHLDPGFRASLDMWVVSLGRAAVIPIGRWRRHLDVDGRLHDHDGRVGIVRADIPGVRIRPPEGPDADMHTPVPADMRVGHWRRGGHDGHERERDDEDGEPPAGHFGRTVITGHGAVRTTRSATLPSMKRAMPLRPCVPITM